MGPLPVCGICRIGIDSEMPERRRLIKGRRMTMGCAARRTQPRRSPLGMLPFTALRGFVEDALNSL